MEKLVCPPYNSIMTITSSLLCEMKDVISDMCNHYQNGSSFFLLIPCGMEAHYTFFSTQWTCLLFSRSPFRLLLTLALCKISLHTILLSPFYLSLSTSPHSFSQLPSFPVVSSFKNLAIPPSSFCHIVSTYTILRAQLCSAICIFSCLFVSLQYIDHRLRTTWHTQKYMRFPSSLVEGVGRFGTEMYIWTFC